MYSVSLSVEECISSSTIHHHQSLGYRLTQHEWSQPSVSSSHLLYHSIIQLYHHSVYQYILHMGNKLLENQMCWTTINLR